jgi:16S rRNA processing protein RimM
VDDFFLIAKIVSTAGNKGFLKIISYSDFPERFDSLKKVFIDFFGEKKAVVVEKVEKQSRKSGILLKFRDFNSPEDVRILVGKNVYVDQTGLVTLPEGFFFIHDVIGSQVFRNGERFGIVKDVLVYPANDVYVIEETGGKEILIPAVKDYVETFDPDKKVLILKPGSRIYENED